MLVTPAISFNTPLANSMTSRVINRMRRQPARLAFVLAIGATLLADPDRVLSTPICENGFAGAALGAAFAGMHPIVELMYPDFILGGSRNRQKPRFGGMATGTLPPKGY